MIIKQKISNIKDEDQGGLLIDYLELEWYETSKRILHKKTNSGREVTLKFLNHRQELAEGDILFRDNQYTIVVAIRTCEAIIVKPRTMYEMAYVCYEIGNKHLPLFYENDELLIPYESPIMKILQASGFKPSIQNRKLMNQLKTSVTPHPHAESKSLFSRILQLTSPNE